MNQVQLKSLSQTQKALVSVAYLMAEKSLRPEKTEKLFNKLEAIDSQANALNIELRNAQKFINDSKPGLQQMIGSINTISEIIADMLPEDKLDEWCLAYNIPEKINGMIPKQQKPVSVDMAGATAKSIPAVDVGDLAK